MLLSDATYIIVLPEIPFQHVFICLVLVGHRNGFERVFTIELNLIVRLLKD